MKKIQLLFVLVLTGLCTFSQEPAPERDTLRKDALNIYMDGVPDYIREAVPFVNYVRDIRDADVYLILTVQQTGSGGREYKAFITGQHEFAGMNDTVSFTSKPDDTTDAIREKEITFFKMSLMRYMIKTPLAEYITIGFSEPMAETVTTDKWNNWVIRPSFSTYFNGQKSYKSRSISGSIRANRITEEWKIRTELEYYYNVNDYDLGKSVVTSDNSSKYASGTVVKSLSDHWSIGGSAVAGADTYENRDFVTYVMPVVEYDVFPYSESTRRQFTFLYLAGNTYNNYHDTTIYNKTKESLWVHGLIAAYVVIQKWGEIHVGFSYMNYLHDWSKNNISLSTNISLRVAKGLSLNLSGGFSIIHDQLGLPKGGATDEQILTKQKELATQYTYYTNFGFSYTFGSIYNNVVNPRFNQLPF